MASADSVAGYCLQWGMQTVGEVSEHVCLPVLTSEDLLAAAIKPVGACTMGMQECVALQRVQTANQALVLEV